MTKVSSATLEEAAAAVTKIFLPTYSMRAHLPDCTAGRRRRPARHPPCPRPQPGPPPG